MAKSQTNAASSAANNLIGTASTATAPIQAGFTSSLGTATANQGNELSGALGDQSTLVGDASTGGYNPTQLANTESGYGTLATTGGYTPKQSQQFIQQATEGATATEGALAQQAKQGAVATGGLGTGGGLSQMARQLGQTQDQGTLNAEVALNQSKTANQLAGLGGESTLETSQAGNKIAAGSAASSQMDQLYSTTTGQITSLGNQVLQTLGLNFSTQEAGINALVNLSKNPGTLSTILSSLTSMGGAAAGAAGALA